MPLLHAQGCRKVKVCMLTLKNRMPQKVLTIGFACTMSDAAYPAEQILPILRSSACPWRSSCDLQADLMCASCSLHMH